MMQQKGWLWMPHYSQRNWANRALFASGHWHCWRFLNRRASSCSKGHGGDSCSAPPAPRGSSGLHAEGHGHNHPQHFPACGLGGFYHHLPNGNADLAWCAFECWEHQEHCRAQKWYRSLWHTPGIFPSSHLCTGEQRHKFDLTGISWALCASSGEVFFFIHPLWFL